MQISTGINKRIYWRKWQQSEEREKKNRTKSPYLPITLKPNISSKENNKSKIKSLLGKQMGKKRNQERALQASTKDLKAEIKGAQ